MVRLRLPATLAVVVIAGAGAAAVHLGCSSGGPSQDQCTPSPFYDDGGPVPPDAGIQCPPVDDNGECPSGCEPPFG